MRLKSALIIAILFFSGQWLYSQEPSKKETEDWLLKKIQVFNIYNEYNNFWFDPEGRFHIEYIFSEPELNSYGTYNHKIIPLKTIDAIEIFEKQDPKTKENFEILKFYSSEENIEIILGSNINLNQSSYKDKEAGITFKIEVKEDDMINRIKKAFIHLIELNGGKLIKDAF
jgi:hypothetical protein